MLNRTSVRRTSVIGSAAVVALLMGAAAPAIALAPKPTKSSTVTFTSGALSVTESAHPAALVRGGAAESVTVTLDNTTGKAAAWDPTIVTGPLVGPSPISANDVRLTVQPLNAPRTGITNLLNGSGFRTEVYPAGTSSEAEFTVPAKSERSWTVTFGLNRSYPANDADVHLAFGYGGVPGSASEVDVTVPTSPNIRPGYLAESLGGGTVAPGKPLDLSLTLHNTGSAPFSSGLEPIVELGADGGVPSPDPMSLQVLENGHWRTLAYHDNRWTLPTLPAGFAGNATHVYHLRLKTSGRHGAAFGATLSSWTGLTGGNDFPVTTVESRVDVQG
jgi:hypothetical protein